MRSAWYSGTKSLLTAIGKEGGAVEPFDARILADIGDQIASAPESQRAVLVPMLDQAKRAHRARGGATHRAPVAAE